MVPDAEKPARDLLPRADLGEGAVFRRVQIDLERLLVRARYFALHTGPIIQKPGVQTSLKKNLREPEAEVKKSLHCPKSARATSADSCDASRWLGAF